MGISVAIAVLQGLAVLFVPWLIMKHKNAKPLKLIGTIGAAYIAGILAALVFWRLHKLVDELALNRDVSEIGSYLAIAVAIPLLLFNSNLKETKKLSKRVLLSFGLLVISVMVVTTAAYYLFGRSIEDGGILSAMAIGLYTGGTPNLNAIGNIFHLDTTSIGIANLADMMIGGIFYIFLLLGCKPLFGRLFKNVKAQSVYYKEDAAEVAGAAARNVFAGNKKVIGTILIALAIAILGALIGVAIWAINGMQDGRMFDFVVPSIMITGTVLGVAMSFNKKVRSVEKSGDVGHYLLLVFSFALATAVNFENLQNRFFGILILYSIITVGVLLVHIVISRLCKIDLDCTMVTLTAGVYGPAFIPALTRQLKNNALTLPGLICGSVGYAIGTFLGMGLGFLFS
jgi:uncharacterized membrane protein